MDVRHENIRVVVGSLAFQGAAKPLEAHAGVHAARRQRFQRTVGAAVVLHENQIPDFDHLGIVPVDQIAARHRRTLGGRTQIDMYLRGRAAGTLIAHLPEIVVLVAHHDAGLGYVFLPDLIRFEVLLQAFGRIPLEHGYVEDLRIDAVHLGEEFPRPSDGFLLEIVAEGPVAQHLEHRVVVRIHAHFLQVVVLSGYAQTLLRVGHAGKTRRREPEKDVLELVHPGIGKHERRVVLEHDRRGGLDMVSFRGEKIEETLPDFLRFHLHFLLILTESYQRSKVLKFC